jgi:glycosyltransferase involved in cell wall biosynthesis
MQARLLVLSSLFPSAAQPNAGLFIRERMFRVGKHRPLVVVAPQPWFPLQGLIRLWRPHFRPMAPRFEIMQGVEVHRPRFLCFPGLLKRLDGPLMALGAFFTVRRLVSKHRLNLLDAHFGHPDGHAGALLARWLRLPMVLTLRGKEDRQARTRLRAPLQRAVQAADRVVTVSDALRQVALSLGAAPERATVIGNGIDLSKFQPMARDDARRRFKLPPQARVLVSVGTLVERKGFHRVIGCLPALLARHADLHFLVVGGAGPEGDIGVRLRAQVEELGLSDRVHFVGPVAPAELKWPLSAADIFVLATAYEGWANVFLEAMACGLPVVSTQVGGNAQVVCEPALGTLVPFVADGDQAELTRALDEALVRTWNREHILAYAQSNAWERRIPPLLDLFDGVVQGRPLAHAAPEASAQPVKSVQPAQSP